MRVRLTAAVTVLVFVVGGGVALWFVNRVERSLVDDVEDRNAALLDEVAAALARGEDPADVLTRVPDAGGGEEQLAFVAAPGYGAPGTVIYVDGRGAADLVGADPFEIRVDGPPGALPVVGGTPDVAVARLPVSSEGGTGELVAASPLEDVRNSVDALRLGLWWAVPALAVAMGGLAWVVTGRALRPVEDIARRADEITTTNLHARVPEPQTGDEVAHLARTVNAMLARLEDGAGRQRRFVSDASHELRSPVAAIRSQVEVGLIDPSTDWQDVGRTVIGETERLERLIDDLLALARASEVTAGGAVPPTPVVPCDVRDVVTTEASRHRRVPVSLELTTTSSVPMPARDLERVVRHLLDNAARHARAGVRVVARDEGGTTGDAVVVMVDDDGAGIPPDARSLVLERFTRLDEARTRDAGGTGLGLAVASELVAAAGGTLVVDESPLGGARLRLTLPRATSPA